MRHPEELLQTVKDLLHDSTLANNDDLFTADALHLAVIPADGSTRLFFRVTGVHGGPICVGVLPSTVDETGMAEAHAAISIGEHLYRRGVVVPEIFAADRETGMILFEDCGDISLQATVASVGGQHSPEAANRVMALYRRVLDNLAYMQVHGKDGFRRTWCYDTSEYDKKLMLHRESGYFYNAFWRDLLGGDNQTGIENEFEEIAERAISGMTGFFLHRDFQSRNILIAGGAPKFIDFQGGRIGPPGYDLASLLIDPYVGLSEKMQVNLLDYYVDVLRSHIDFDRDIFLKQYRYLKLQRNLQILGAFAFLYKRRGKPFFREYLKPSLESLAGLLSERVMGKYSRLSAIVDAAGERLEKVLAGD